ncbi:response regulator transcription factor [Flavobacterium sp. K5-23]|uniref:response regulator transcription factor n=1 Tax=Flavobacterium sp. K5-23 TaxID=2746225 RepID=UPI00200D676F|nr:response regulator transcription factor [Flavobacterium sp. K5-23]UQD57565.1 response regulator transcription factor [Flavobacterium sp. K5-23]
MNNRIKIILVDDEILFRKGISFLLEREKNIEIFFEASDGNELLTFLKESIIHPDIIIMDLNMPSLNGVEATKIINNEYPNIKIIALTSYNTKSFIVNMMNVGAASYLMKNATPEELVITIMEVNERGFYYNEDVMKIIHETVSSNKITKTFFDPNFLTSRENEVLELICLQKTTVEIGEILFISPRTVEGHRNNLLLKTESRNIAGLVVFAIRNGIVTLGDLLK